MSGDNHNHADRARCWRSECRNACCYPDACSERAPVSGNDHPMHPLVDAGGHITATGEAFVQRAGEIMDDAVAKAGGDVARYCGRGVCAAMEGHEGTCSEASGWEVDEDEDRRYAAWLALKPYLPLLYPPRPADPQREFDMAEPS